MSSENYMHNTSKILIIDDLAIAIDKIDNAISLLKSQDILDSKLEQLKNIKRDLKHVLKRI